MVGSERRDAMPRLDENLTAYIDNYGASNTSAEGICYCECSRRDDINESNHAILYELFYWSFMSNT